MSKRKSNPPEAAASIQETPTMSTIKVQGVDMPVSPRYNEGDTLSANEASALNQVRYENLRNNFAARIAKAKEAQGESFSVDAEYTIDGTVFPPIATQWADFSAAYEFGARKASTGTKRVTDPVEREALRLAKAAVDAAIAKKKAAGDSAFATVSKENLKELYEKHAKGEAILAQARANVASLGEIDLGLDIE